jgi:acetyl esterase/lipase
MIDFIQQMKIRTQILFVVVIFYSMAGKAQTSGIIHLWPGLVPGETEAKHPSVQKMDTSGHFHYLKITSVTDPTLIVFKPKASLNNHAGVIVCPGGGYHILAVDLEGYEVAKWLNKLGFTAFVLQYRVPKKREGALNDIQRALRIIRSQASTWQMNPSKLGVLGFSAGGSLAARASTNYNKETYYAVDTIDQQSSRPDFALLIYPAYLNLGENKSITPELTITKNTPPMFIFQTADDGDAGSGLVMADTLRKAKVPVELHLLPFGPHGYGLRKGNDAAETWPTLAAKWLKKTISGQFIR